MDEYKKLSVDKDDWTIHPLPLLTAFGNDRGGGDFHEGNMGFEFVDSWAWQLISIADKPPASFSKIDFHRYKYATATDVLEKVNAALIKHGLASVVTPNLLNMQQVTTAKGNVEQLATVEVVVTLIDAESGETLTLKGLGSRQDSGDTPMISCNLKPRLLTISLSKNVCSHPKSDMISIL